jgi:hypothetical protein
MRQSIAKLSKMPENLSGYQHGKSANQTHESIVATLGQLNSLCVMCYIIFRCPLCQLFYVHVL